MPELFTISRYSHCLRFPDAIETNQSKGFYVHPANVYHRGARAIPGRDLAIPGHGLSTIGRGDLSIPDHGRKHMRR